MRPSLTDIHGQQFDVAVIGAGINGTSTASKLAAQGYKVLLVDKGDFGGGSSSRSSRLLHCGLNQMAAAKEAKGLRSRLSNVLAARQMLGFRIHAKAKMPERIQQHDFFIPVLSSAPVSIWQFRAAFAALGALRGFREKLHFRHWPNSKRASDPFLRRFSGDVQSIVSFSDCVYDWPERICVDYAIKAEASGATVRNYTELKAAHPSPQGWRLRLADSFEDADAAEVRCRLLLNMAGVWTDTLSAMSGGSNRPTVTPNKGCHIAVQLPAEFAGKGIICRNELGHLFICVPWRGLHIIGPTETPYSGSLDDVRPEEDDVEGLLAQANALLPDLKLTQRDVVFRWAGLRPAAYQEGNPRGAWNREFHDLSPNPASPLLSMAWGRIVDHPDTSSRLAELVTKKIGAPAAHSSARSEQRRPTTKGDLTAIVAFEQAMTVADVLFRRTGHGWNPDMGIEKAAEVARILAQHHKRLSEEELLEEYKDLLRTRFNFFT